MRRYGREWLGVNDCRPAPAEPVAAYGRTATVGGESAAHAESRACTTRSATSPSRPPRCSPTSSAPAPSSSSTWTRSPAARGPVLYRYRPLTERFIRERWDLPPRAALLPHGGRDARQRRHHLPAREGPARRAGRAGAPGDARAALRGRHQLRVPGGALRARLRGGRADALPGHGARHRAGLAARRLHRRPARGAGRRFGARARRRRRRAARGRLAGGSRGAGHALPARVATSRSTTRFRWRRPRARFRELVGGLRLFKAGAVALGRGGLPPVGRWPLDAASAGSHRGRARRGVGARGRRGEGAASSSSTRSAARPPTGRWPGRSGASIWAARANGSSKPSPTTCWRCARCSTPPATPAARASACAWPRSAPRRASGAWCSGGWSWPSRSSAC